MNQNLNNRVADSVDSRSLLQQELSDTKARIDREVEILRRNYGVPVEPLRELLALLCCTQSAIARSFSDEVSLVAKEANR